MRPSGRRVRAALVGLSLLAAPWPASAQEAIGFVGHWAKHAVLVACVSSDPGGDERSSEDGCTRCVVLPEAFALLEARRPPEPLGCSDRLVLPEAASPALRVAAEAFRVPRDGRVAGPLAALGVRELLHLGLSECGLASLGDGPGALPLEWFRAQPPVAAELPPLQPEAVTAATSCVPLGDGTVALPLRRVIDEDPREETAALVRLRPPPGAFERGWLAGRERGRTLRFVGFSRLGRVAWLDVPGSAAPASGPARLTVTDLVTDRVALRVDVSLGRSDDDRAAAEETIVRHLRAAEISPPWPLYTRPLPLVAAGVEYRAVLRARGDSCELHLVTADGRSKRLAVLDGEVSRAAPQVEGAVQSPFEPRAAVLVTYADRAGGRAGVVFGARLATGLERRPLPAGECSVPTGP